MDSNMENFMTNTGEPIIATIEKLKQGSLPSASRKVPRD
jgi:hypothetical protein